MKDIYKMISFIRKIPFFKKQKEMNTVIYESAQCKFTDNNQQSFHVSVATNVGKVRQNNEDNYFVELLGSRNSVNSANEIVLDSYERCVFAVCDGMGGESFGEEASGIAVSVLTEYMTKIKSIGILEISDLINNYASEANNRICDMVENKRCNRSGSTLAMVCMVGTKAYVFSIGDSRVYYFNNDVLIQVTEDQTLAVKKLKANIYTEEEAKASLDSHKITSFLGVDNRRIGLRTLSYEPFDVDGGTLLICSDGLTDMCSDEEIKQVLSLSDKNLAQALINKALDNGGIDNVTCIVVKDVCCGGNANEYE